MKLYVGNLPFQTTADDLLEAFGQYGTVTQAQIIMDRDTGRSRGFGFVEMSAGGDQAIASLNGADMDGRALTVNEAKPREERPRTGGGGGGGFKPRGRSFDRR
jgi:RNA recognition motif-containing protein